MMPAPQPTRAGSNSPENSSVVGGSFTTPLPRSATTFPTSNWVSPAAHRSPTRNRRVHTAQQPDDGREGDEATDRPTRTSNRSPPVAARLTWRNSVRSRSSPARPRWSRGWKSNPNPTSIVTSPPGRPAGAGNRRKPPGGGACASQDECCRSTDLTAKRSSPPRSLSPPRDTKRRMPESTTTGSLLRPAGPGCPPPLRPPGPHPGLEPQPPTALTALKAPARAHKGDVEPAADRGVAQAPALRVRRRPSLQAPSGAGLLRRSPLGRALFLGMSLFPNWLPLCDLLCGRLFSGPFSRGPFQSGLLRRGLLWWLFFVASSAGASLGGAPGRSAADPHRVHRGLPLSSKRGEPGLATPRGRYDDSRRTANASPLHPGQMNASEAHGSVFTRSSTQSRARGAPPLPSGFSSFTSSSACGRADLAESEAASRTA